jgi:hypothetical protein
MDGMGAAKKYPGGTAATPLRVKPVRPRNNPDPIRYRLWVDSLEYLHAEDVHTARAKSMAGRHILPR